MEIAEALAPRWTPLSFMLPVSRSFGACATRCPTVLEAKQLRPRGPGREQARLYIPHECLRAAPAQTSRSYRSIPGRAFADSRVTPYEWQLSPGGDTPATLSQRESLFCGSSLSSRRCAVSSEESCRVAERIHRRLEI